MVDTTDSGSQKITFANLEAALSLTNLTGSIDISSQSNLAVSGPITLTDDTVGFDFSTGNTWTGTNDFNDDVTVTTDLTVDTDTLYVDSTSDRVGIGTDSPDGIFHIDGSEADDGIYWINNGNNSWYINHATGGYVPMISNAAINVVSLGYNM